MAEDKKSYSRHTVTMERRENVSMTGIVEVISFDEETIIADTEMGVLILRGSNLHVNSLNLENGDLEVSGVIVNLFYEEQSTYGKGKSSLFGKLFK